MHPDPVISRDDPPTAAPAPLYWLAVALVLLLLIAPLWLLDYPGLGNHFDHLARCYVLGHYQDNPLWPARYELSRAPIPNLAMDLIIAPLTRWMPVLAAGKVFLTLMAVLFVGGCVALGRTVQGQWSWIALLAGLDFYNSMLFSGWTNYLFGVGLLLLALACWLRWRERWNGPRFAAMCLLSVLAYLSHLTSFCMLAVACCMLEWMSWRRERETLRSLFRLAWIVLPVGLMAIFMHTNGRVGLLRYFGVETKLVHLLQPLITFRPRWDAAMGALVLGCLLAVRSQLRLRPIVWVGAVFVLLFLLCPDRLLTVGGADVRMLLPGALLIVLAIDVPATRLTRALFVLLFAGMLVRTALVIDDWKTIDAAQRQVLALGDALPMGARVLTVTANHRDVPKLARYYYYLVPMWTVTRDADVSSFFANRGQQPLIARRPACFTNVQPLAVCLQQYDYVWIQHPTDAELAFLGRTATPVSRWQDVWLWKIKRPPA